jgi:hypothetical protein
MKDNHESSAMGTRNPHHSEVIRKADILNERELPDLGEKKTTKMILHQGVEPCSTAASFGE